MIITAKAPQFIKEESSAHWYQVDGSTVKPRHDATLREARKERLFPSPTSIEKDIRANPTLLRWIKNEIAKAFVFNPRHDGEEEQAYVDRVMKIADSARDLAAIRGTDIHAAIENDGTTDATIAPFYEAYLPWHREHVQETIYSEKKMQHPNLGVAGTCDRVIIHPVHGRTILDYKTQKIRKEANFYDNFPRQLAFYAECDRIENNLLKSARIMSVVIDSQKPSRPVEKLYSPEQQEQSYKEFALQVWLWCSSKDYWPVGKWDIVT